MAAKDNVPKNAWTKLNEAEEQADPFGYLAALLSDDGLGRYSDRFQQLQRMIAERIASDREGFLDQRVDQVTGTISYCRARMGAARELNPFRDTKARMLIVAVRHCRRTSPTP